jgi:hypothetical protein
VIITRKIEFFVKDTEYQELKKLRGQDTWREAILKRLGLDVESIPVGRPAATDLDDLFGEGWAKKKEGDE